MDGIIEPATESLDDLLLGGYKIIQPKKGYRFAIDAVLLAHFPELATCRQAVDLGTGGGIIPVILSYRCPGLKIVGVEIQHSMAERAKRSIKYNSLESTVDIKLGDIKEIHKYLPSEQADLVTCNPPFWRKGDGKLNLNEEICGARHEIWAELNDFIKAAEYLLRGQGSLYMIQRTERLQEIIERLRENRLSLLTLRLVHSFSDKKAALVMLRASKGDIRRPLTVEPPLIIYSAPGIYGDEVLRYYARRQ
ncbi:MAG: methyltransferase [Syntrophomonadaceae bacterium]|jgi:tRNA1Val (adenine37-N6)-methyltransferase|nr:methyltransferase [Syntrophomonadaceae bacterium]